MKDDTMKSLGFLKKSLKMNAKAINNNEVSNGQPLSKDFADFIDHAHALLVQIETWEKARIPVVPAVPVDTSINQPGISTYVPP